MHIRSFAHLLVAVLVALPSASVAAQIRLPEASPQARVHHEIGISSVTIEWHRPGVKGRTIWGGLVPYDQVWRLGANEATTLELSHDATINGTPISSGKYALFAIPGRDRWTFIVNSRAEQWGAYFHDPARDVLRFEAKPASAPFQEWLSFELNPLDGETLEAAVHWERVRVPFRIHFDVDTMVWDEIDRTLGDPARATWDDYHTAARYSLQTGKRLEEGLKWVDRAMQHEESFWNYELKARLLHATGRTAEALPLLNRAIATAEGKAPKEYVDGLRQTAREWKGD